MRLFCLMAIVAIPMGCKLYKQVAENKFATYVQSGHRDGNEATILIRKAHYPQWRICYSIECPASKIARKQYEQAITKSLQTWLQPLAELTNTKLIGSDPDDFVYEYHPNITRRMCRINKANYATATTGDKDNYVLTVRFVDGQDGTNRSGRIYAPCLGNDQAQSTLLHRIGHVFGLLDTYTSDDKLTLGLQPLSVMSCAFERNEKNALILAEDDIKGVQWQYRYYQHAHLKAGIAPVSLHECPSPHYKYVRTTGGGVCRPRYLFMHTLQQAHHFEKTHTSFSYARQTLNKLFPLVGAEEGGKLDLEVNYQDSIGNTGLHYLVLFGAYSLWNKHQENTADVWSKKLAEFLNVEVKAKDKLKYYPCDYRFETNCIDPNTQNIYGDTALHFAARRGYVQAVKLLLAHHYVHLRVENKQGKTACDLVKHKETSLPQAGLCDIKGARTQPEATLQALQKAHAQIFNLLNKHKSCY